MAAADRPALLRNLQLLSDLAAALRARRIEVCMRPCLLLVPLWSAELDVGKVASLWPCLTPPLCSLQAGAVELESAELRFKTDAQGKPTTVAVKQVMHVVVGQPHATWHPALCISLLRERAWCNPVRPVGDPHDAHRG